MSNDISGRDKGSGVYVLSVCAVAALGGLLFGYDTGVINGAIGPLKAHFILNPKAEGWAMGCALLGCAIGAAVAGMLSDRFGRKKVLVLSAVLFFISAVGTALPTAPSDTKRMVPWGEGPMNALASGRSQRHNPAFRFNRHLLYNLSRPANSLLLPAPLAPVVLALLLAPVEVRAQQRTGPPVIDIWYGTSQVFGNPGLAQRWVNILGNVSDPDGIQDLTY